MVPAQRFIGAITDYSNSALTASAEMNQIGLSGTDFK
jgi:hypothetical protein